MSRWRTTTLMGLWIAAAVWAGAERPLRIYLPQEVQVDGDTALLGRVGMLLGDPALIEKAQPISLGTFAAEGQTLRVDRHTVLSRLASSGIPAGQVQMLGAETVQIVRNEVVISAERLIACAQRYLESSPVQAKEMKATVIRPPQPQVVSAEGGAAELMVTDDVQQGGGVRRIQVSILQNGKTVGGEAVFFSVRYPVRRVMAAQELAPGTPLTSENIRVEIAESDRPEPEGWVVPYGMAARHRIAAGAAITETMLEPKQEPIVIRRRQNVLVRLDNGALLISAPGEAMDDGRVGELVRVRRGQRPYERIIVCRVQADGTVEPIL